MSQLVAISISAADARPLRRSVLRPNQPPEACVYPGDDDPVSFHLGVRAADDAAAPLIAVASFYAEPVPVWTVPGETGSAWRIRGMATDPEYRSHGLGSALARAGIERARAITGANTPVWCNARATAAGYYERLGFRAVGDEFEIDGIGPHRVMRLG